VGLLTSWLSRRGGGIAEMVLPLARHLAGQTCEVRVFGMADPFASCGQERLDHLELRTFAPRRPFSFGFAPDLQQALASADLDVLHTHGLWMYPSLAGLRWGRRHRKPWLVSPHGMLDGWALRHSRWKKAIATRLFEQAHLRGAACLHALNEAEARSIRTFGLDNPLCIVPNGVEVPAGPLPERTYSGTRNLLFLGRLTPKKGLRELLLAWAAVRSEAEKAGWRLVVAGWSDSRYEAELRRGAVEASIGQSVTFLGPTFGSAKDEAFRSAHAFILPSLSEGMPLAVLEAWAYALPVLITPACNLPEGLRANAAIEIQSAPAAMTKGLRQLLTMSGAELLAMGVAGRRLVEERYSWPRVAATLGAVYAWILGAGPPPPCLVPAGRPLHDDVG
jgi:glycosyltransferase involved in cell wall biosynthesis